VVTVGDATVCWHEGLSLADILRELGLPEGYPLAEIDGTPVWKQDWDAAAVPDGARVRFHWMIGGG